jgi:hypothetical protein
MSKTLLVKPRTKNDLKLISNLLKKLKIESSLIDDEQLEDAGLTLLMKEADRTKKVSRDLIMRKLSR